MRDFRWYYRFTLISNIVFNFIVLIQGTDVKGFDDTVLFKINWPGRSGNDLLETSDAEPLLVTTANNERYKCLLPHFQEKEKDSFDTYSGPNPLELLAPLFTQSSCSYKLESYWTYEVCHGRYIRQYHEEREGKKVKLQEYYLGKWNKTQFAKLNEEQSRLEHQGKNLRADTKASFTREEEVPVKKIDGLNMPYLQVNMSDGTLCDLNGKPRLTRVLYVCYSHSKHDIFSLKETSICEYEVIILSPLLCQHPKYKPQESGENVINCHPFQGSPKRPKNLVAMEAESLKLRHQKISDGEARVRVEIHPVEVTTVDNDDMGLASPSDPVRAESMPVPDTAPVLSFLSGKNCLDGGSGWWKYQFCYGISVDQYHVEKDGTKTVIQLGKFDKAKHLDWLEKNPHKRPKPRAHRRQISHLYSDGTLCDKTGRPRQTEVKLKCLENTSNFGAVALYLLEPKTCEYILGVESPLICNILSRADENGLVKMTEVDDIADEVIVSSEDDEDSSNEVTDSFDKRISNGDD
ncbi:Endoplasmic reticulum lectin 1 [Cryptotermes secundus]|uniref:Endoplasmic reticulum lectin 1 n=1 Tax=Cryptotermes secundus TaxID=105785 RepID=A0A2J7Q8B1_9NEOP|nr:endoplasmic reticulum lectin 1 isoform X2 [Cryptotermes secundus]PNF24823.1 Endoplasmic reticulum lectin 1 [Cryptotermes secundus]